MLPLYYVADAIRCSKSLVFLLSRYFVGVANSCSYQKQPSPLQLYDHSTMSVAALRRRYPFIAADTAVDNLVIGAGVVGMAIARQISKSIQGSTFVVER